MALSPTPQIHMFAVCSLHVRKFGACMAPVLSEWLQKVKKTCKEEGSMMIVQKYFKKAVPIQTLNFLFRQLKAEQEKKIVFIFNLRF